MPECARHRRLLFFALALVCLPIVAFYVLTLHEAVNLPFLDDYDAILTYMLDRQSLPSLSARLGFALSAPHSGYRLVFEHAVVELNFLLLHRINFFFLQVAGSLFLLPVAWLLWENFHPEEAGISERLLLFAPVPYLLFQLQYAETLNWAMAELQNLPVIFFSLLCIHCLLHWPSRKYLAAGFFAFLLAVASSKNGLVVAVPGTIILMRAKRVRLLLGWISLTALLAYAYSYGNPVEVAATGLSPQPSPHMLPRPDLAFVLSFLGASLVRSRLIFGALLCVALAALAFLSGKRANAFACYASLFVLGTALGVSAFRSAPEAPRYTIYSALFLGIVYVLLTEYLSTRAPRQLLRMLVAALCISFAFSLHEDVLGLRFLRVRRMELVAQSETWHREGHLVLPGQSLAGFDTSPDLGKLAQRAERILHASENGGIYQVPAT